MTRERRQRLKIFCFGVLPAAALAIDAWFYVSMKGWTYSLRASGADVFWPGVLLLGLMFFPLAAASVGYDRFHDWSERGSARWPIADGRVTAGSIYVAYGLLTRYLPQAGYAYEVAGTMYRNLVLAPGLRSRMYRNVLSPPGLKTREEAEEVLRSYPVGAPLRVYYDPDDPGTSVLETGDKSAFRTLGLALLFAALPFLIVALIVAWR